MNFNNIIIDLRIEDFVKRKTLIVLSFQIHILIKLKIQLLLINIYIYIHTHTHLNSTNHFYFSTTQILINFFEYFYPKEFLLLFEL